MRVLHCFKVYRPDQNGGIEEAISWIAKGAPPDIESSVLVCRTNGFGSRVVVDSIPVQRTTTFGQVSSVPLSPTYIPHMLRRLRDVDVVALHAPFPLADIGLLLGLDRRQALVMHWHADILGRDWLKPLYAPLIRRSLQRADRILASSQSLIDSSSFLAGLEAKCRVLPLGIDMEPWSNPADPALVARVRAENPRLVVACGRLVPYKGFDVLIRAMQHVDGSLIIVGAGKMRDRLDALIGELNLRQKVRLAGFLDRQDQICIVNAAKVFVLPSTTSAETFGISQLEAMSAGIPVVNTNLTTGVPKVARHMQEALTVAPGDEAELAAAVTALLDDPALACRLGGAGKLRARDFDWRTFSAGVAGHYRDALAERMR